MTNPFLPTDLSDLFSSPAAGAAQPVMYRQGTIVSFNPNTLENTVNVGGTIMANLPVLGVAESATFVKDAVVGILAVNSSWVIVGRFVIPNTPAATSAISLLSNRTFVSKVAAFENVPGAAFGDLPSFGPAVTVNVGPSGRIEAIISALMSASAFGAGTPQNLQEVGLALSGANTASPATGEGLYFEGQPSGGFNTDQVACSRTMLFEGLTPGLTTFTCKYRATNIGLGNQSIVGQRVLEVVVL